MSEDRQAAPALRQLLWIAAGVAVLTLIVVAASWLFSPRPAPGEPSFGRGPGVLPEGNVERQTFSPEAPAPGSGRTPTAPAGVPEQPPAALLPPAAPPQTTSESLPEELAEPRLAPAPESSAPPPPTSAKTAAKAAGGAFGLQAGAFAEESKARDVGRRIEGLGYKTAILHRDGKYKVIATGFPTRAAAAKAQTALNKAGLKDSFIVPME